MIYSTVLGGVLTSIENKANGDWHETKIYAGGAVIGEQKKLIGGAGTEFITYFHADPVTGSRREVTQAGGPTGNYSEDYEALGQKIDPTPPFEEDPPPNPLPVFNTSEFPEWQCSAELAMGRSIYNGYYEMPTHCQRAAEQDVWNKVTVLWPSWPGKEGNISKLIDSPIMRDWAGGSANANSLALSSMVSSMHSTKKDDPYEGGDLATVTINAPGPPELDFSFKDANFSDVVINGNDKNRKALDKVAEKITKRISDHPDCAKLLDGVDAANILKSSTSIGDKRPSGNAFSGPVEAAAALSNRGTKGERIAGGKIGFNKNSFFFTDKLQDMKGEFAAKDFFEDSNVRENNGFGDLSYSEIKELLVIHELVHLADVNGTYDDLGKVNKSLNLKIVESCFQSKPKDKSKK